MQNQSWKMDIRDGKLHRNKKNILRHSGLDEVSVQTNLKNQLILILILEQEPNLNCYFEF